METQHEAPPIDVPPMTALEQYAAYPFNTDQEYQQGLASIMLGWVFEDPSSETREEMLRRTRVFYFNKMTGNNLSMDEARQCERGLRARDSELTSASPEPPASSSTVVDETRVLSFAELKELIESGRVDQIPNNKIIPEKFSEEPPSQSTATVRKKPWETGPAQPLESEST